MGNSYRHFAYFCHAELADLRTLERSENRLASRLSLLEQSSLGESLRAWSKSKTVSASGRHYVLPVSLDRSRNEFGMTVNCYVGLYHKAIGH